MAATEKGIGVTALEILLEKMSGRGLSLKWADDGTPRIVGPAEAKTPKLMEALKAFKPELLEYMQAQQPRPEPKAGAKSEPATEPVPEAAPEPPRKLQVVTVPPGAKIYAQLDGGRPCEPNDPAAYIWCYENAPQWWYTKDTPIPRG